MAKRVLLISLLCLLVYFPVFMQLDGPPIGLWDESRFSVNALEMTHNGNPMVLHFQGQPDLWNTKPPLMFWLQAIGIRIIGPNELAVRLPAAFAGLLSCFILFFFCLKYFKSYWPAFGSVLVLITSQGYLLDHGCRSGNTDCLLGFFMLLYLMAFYVFTITENPMKRKRAYLFFFIGLLLAAYTKGIAAFFFLPSLFVYLIIEQKAGLVFRNKWTYIFSASLIILLTAYYLIRESMGPGYLSVVLKSELFERFTKPQENHVGNFWWYFNHLKDYQFSYFFLLILPGFAVGLISKDSKIKKFSLFLLINTLLFFLLLSFGKTKTEWYHVPLYPLLALSVGIFVYWLAESLNSIEALHMHHKYKIAGLILFFLIFINPYSKTIQKIYHPVPINDYEYEMVAAGEYLQNALRKNKDINNSLIAVKGIDWHLRFYTEAMNYRGKNITITDSDTFQPGKRVIAYQYEVKNNIETHYSYQLQEKFKSVKVYIIGQPKGLPAVNIN